MNPCVLHFPTASPPAACAPFAVHVQGSYQEKVSDLIINLQVIHRSKLNNMFVARVMQWGNQALHSDCNGTFTE